MATTFKNGQESSQKVKVTGIERVGKDTKLDKINITYTRTDDDKGATLTAGKFTSTFTDEEKTLIKNSKETGEEVTLVKMFQAKDGAPNGGYWNLKAIKPLSAYAEKPKNTYQKSGGTAKTGGGYNEAGVKAGAVLHDAVAVAVAKFGKETTTEKIAAIARELLTLSTQLENEVRNGNFSNSSNTTGSSNTATKVVEAPLGLGPKDTSTTDNEYDDLDSLLDDFNALD